MSVVLNNASANAETPGYEKQDCLTIKICALQKIQGEDISDYDEYKYIAGMNVYDR